MTLKRVTSPVAGDASHYGGVDINKIADLLDGTDIIATESPAINTNLPFRDQKFRIRNPANTFSYIFAASAITTADRTVTLPLLTGNDQVTMDAFASTLTNKTINATNNSITDSSQATGDILKNNGSKFVRLARGSSLQVLRTNSGGTDIEWASVDAERVGKSTASGNGSTTAFTIAHGLGSTPGYTFISVASSGSAVIAAKADSDATNITVTFASAPSSGSNNVVIYWRVVAS